MRKNLLLVALVIATAAATVFAQTVTARFFRLRPRITYQLDHSRVNVYCDEYSNIIYEMHSGHAVSIAVIKGHTCNASTY